MLAGYVKGGTGVFIVNFEHIWCRFHCSLWINNQCPCLKSWIKTLKRLWLDLVLVPLYWLWLCIRLLENSLLLGAWNLCKSLRFYLFFLVSYLYSFYKLLDEEIIITTTNPLSKSRLPEIQYTKGLLGSKLNTFVSLRCLRRMKLYK